MCHQQKNKVDTFIIMRRIKYLKQKVCDTQLIDLGTNKNWKNNEKSHHQENNI